MSLTLADPAITRADLDPQPDAIRAAQRRLAAAVIIKAAKDYRDQPIYTKRQKQQRQIIEDFLLGKGDTRLWHRIGGYDEWRMGKLIEFAEGEISFHTDAVLEANGITIEEELADVETQIEEMEG